MINEKEPGINEGRSNSEEIILNGEVQNKTVGQNKTADNKNINETDTGDVNETIENHLVGAILVTFFCCVPFGIASIISASKVNTLLEAGKIAEAREESEKAKKWMVLGAVLGGIVLGISILIQLILIPAGMN